MNQLQRSIEKIESVDEPTQKALIAAAMELFANEGVNAVSIRRIVSESGAANQSAIHYHFKNKLGLLQAILDEINHRLGPMQTEALSELREIAAERMPTVREIVVLGCAPYLTLFQSSHEGRVCIRLLSRLTWESGENAQAMLIQNVQPFFNQLKIYLAEILPYKTDAELEFHLYMMVSNLFHGLSDITLLSHDPGGIVNRLYYEQQQDMLRYFYNYMCAGLASRDEASA